VMLTGDSKITADAVARELGIACFGAFRPPNSELVRPPNSEHSAHPLMPRK